jgi:hypothetical protein
MVWRFAATLLPALLMGAVGCDSPSVGMLTSKKAAPAASALGWIGPRAAEAVPHLQQLMLRDWAVRNAAQAAVIRIKE